MVVRRLTVLVLSLVLLSTIAGPALSWNVPPPPPPPRPQPKEGCTPGFWKQAHHFDSWRGFTPGQTLFSAGFRFPASLSSFNGVTLLTALQGGGGPGLTGAAQILMRAAVAALLNASSLVFGFTPAEVISFTNGALASESRSDILNQAAQWDRFNNLGCPLN